MTSQSGWTSPDSIGKSRKRKRSIADVERDHTFLSKERDLSHKNNILPSPITVRQEDDVDEILKNFFEDSDTTSDDDSPGRSSHSGVDTPDTIYSLHTDQTLTTESPPTLANQKSSRPWNCRVQESQHAFTLYTSSSTSHRKYKGPSSLQAFSEWLQLNTDGLNLDFSEQFRHGTSHCEEMDMPPTLNMPALCVDWHIYTDAYFQEIAPFFPVIGREQIVRAATYLSRYDHLEERPTGDRPAMACVYACIALGARTKGQIGIAQAYIESACSLVGHLVSLPYMESAQALLLISLEHRGRSKSGAASMALGQALRIFSSMGLHQKLFGCDDYLSPARQRSDQRTWLTACALEQNLAFESGRPSSVRSCQFDRNILNAASDVPADFLKPLVNLAHIQSQITETLFDQSICATPPDLDGILTIQGELDESLTRWSDNLPEPWRPRRGLLRCPPALLAFRTSLTFHFHQALITLHRTALIDGLSADTSSVRAKGNHGRRLQKSEGICANSARDILTTYLQYIEQGHPSPFITLNQPLLAVYVLTVYNLKHRSAWSARTDLALLGSSAKAIRDGYQEHGMPPGFCDMLATLERRVNRGAQPEDGPMTSIDSQPGETPWESPTTDESASVFGSEFGPLDVDVLLETQLLASLQSQEMAFESPPLNTIPGIEDQDLREWLDSPRLSDEEILSYRL
ncbi:hypothetical protein D6C91_04922 [Aureobasidium pullulans]|uniref:Xylanolytic transcriptional activator regulatory domain-containing protein n=1 Tax=Aureobasidium pullulans TaxID=5580 RepID=A0A4S9T7W8_AURPU|nr:hypothetical protein D6C91_04922 [Aureobasidium pullulans]